MEDPTAVQNKDPVVAPVVNLIVVHDDDKVRQLSENRGVDSPITVDSTMNLVARCDSQKVAGEGHNQQSWANTVEADKERNDEPEEDTATSVGGSAGYLEH
ncbi:hypothetical protein NE237_024181 [Protea cynaroides]|uniref:Uncharacterized protein n=1 Tax=Protea cynaroides TaxID=273540 RepID=A0A9Q0HHK9_9MAGN|nr:hypothetical protein NE237_024181 [Protea cynaroides]